MRDEVGEIKTLGANPRAADGDVIVEIPVNGFAEINADVGEDDSVFTPINFFVMFNHRFEILHTRFFEVGEIDGIVHVAE